MYTMKKNTLDKIAQHNTSSGTIIVVIDDDPTGCQTIHGVKVATSWDSELLNQLLQSEKLFFLLANTRSVSGDEAEEANAEIVGNLLAVCPNTENIKIISRSDSTLRGHFFVESKILIDLLGPFDGLIFIPFFKEGGRVTKEDTHFVLQDGNYIPAHETEFAKDPLFSFQNSHLPSYIEEKSAGFWKKEDCLSITLEDIRSGGAELVAEKLMQAENNRPVIINSETYDDLEIATWGICLAEKQGKKFLYRTAASFVKTRGGISSKEVFTPKEKTDKGLIVAGSFVQRTTDQINYLKRDVDLSEIVVEIDKIFENFSGYQQTILGKIEQVLNLERTALMYTERTLKKAGGEAEQLKAGKLISDFISGVVNKLTVKPDFVIAKGGITSHDVATKGLGIVCALVEGQVAPGVPIWKMGEESKFPGSYFIVFPGNVGEKESLSRVVLKFKNK